MSATQTKKAPKKGKTAEEETADTVSKETAQTTSASARPLDQLLSIVTSGMAHFDEIANTKRLATGLLKKTDSACLPMFEALAEIERDHLKNGETITDFVKSHGFKLSKSQLSKGLRAAKRCDFLDSIMVEGRSATLDRRPGTVSVGYALSAYSPEDQVRIWVEAATLACGGEGGAEPSVAGLTKIAKKFGIEKVKATPATPDASGPSEFQNETQSPGSEPSEVEKLRAEIKELRTMIAELTATRDETGIRSLPFAELAAVVAVTQLKVVEPPAVDRCEDCGSIRGPDLFCLNPYCIVNVNAPEAPQDDPEPTEAGSSDPALEIAHIEPQDVQAEAPAPADWTPITNDEMSLIDPLVFDFTDPEPPPVRFMPVYGDTYPHRATLAKLGGKFDEFNRCWYVPVTVKPQVDALGISDDGRRFCGDCNHWSFPGGGGGCSCNRY